MLVNFYLMLPCRCAQIFPNGINGGIGKPFVECLHDELCRDIPTDVVLKSNVPSKIL